MRDLQKFPSAGHIPGQLNHNCWEHQYGWSLSSDFRYRHLGENMGLGFRVILGWHWVNLVGSVSWNLLITFFFYMCCGEMCFFLGVLIWKGLFRNVRGLELSERRNDHRSPPQLMGEPWEQEWRGRCHLPPPELFTCCGRCGHIKAQATHWDCAVSCCGASQHRAWLAGYLV